MARKPHYDPRSKALTMDGTVLGHIVLMARPAAGTPGSTRDRGTLAEGTRKYYWTACPDNSHMWGWYPGKGGSIGTRFATCDDAIEALVDYHDLAGITSLDWPQYRKRRWGF